MSYQILIVDDEPIIRKGIMASINWQQEDVNFCGEASNGKEALELIPELRPDIIITDIRMPIMDGLKLVKEVRQNYPSMRIIILSGYDDFEYAQQAIQSGVESYLLKPVGAEQLIIEVRQLIERIKVDRARIQSEERNMKLIREHYQSLKRAYSEDLLRGRFQDMEQLHNQATALGLDIGADAWLAIVFSIDDFLLWSEMESELDQDSLRYLVLNIVEEVLQGESKAFGVMGDLDQLIAFAGVSENSMSIDQVKLKFDGKLQEIQQHVERYLNCTLTIGVGRPVHQLTEIAVSWKQAASSVRQKAYLGKNSLIYYRDEFDSSESISEYPSESERQIIAHLRLADRQAMCDAVSDYFAVLRENRAGIAVYRRHCQRLLLMSVGGLEDSGITSRSLHQEQNNTANRLNQLETADDFESTLCDFFDFLLTLVAESKEERYTGFVRTTMDYVRDHYQEELSLTTLAQAIHITPNYLSKLFKKETGTNFVDWLNQYRVEMAKDLLISHPELKGYEIAEQTGFHDYKYFTYVFKKFAKTTPMEFRSEKI